MKDKPLPPPSELAPKTAEDMKAAESIGNVAAHFLPGFTEKLTVSIASQTDPVVKDPEDAAKKVLGTAGFIMGKMLMAIAARAVEEMEKGQLPPTDDKEDAE